MDERAAIEGDEFSESWESRLRCYSSRSLKTSRVILWNEWVHFFMADEVSGD